MRTRRNRIRRVRRVAGQGAAFTPGVLAGLYAAPAVADARAAGLLWQDAAKTTPAAASGDPVRVVRCPYTGVEFTAPDDASRATLTQSGSLWYLAAGGTSRYTFAGLNSSPLSAHLAHRPAAAGTAGVFVGAAAGGQKFKVSDSTSMMVGGKEGAYNWSPSTTPLVSGTDYVGGLDYGATGAAVYWRNAAADGTADADVTDSNPGAPVVAGTQLVSLLSNTAAAEKYNGRVYAWALYGAAQSAADLAVLHRWLGTYAGLVL